MDFSYGISHSSNATGKSILLSPLNGRDAWGFDNGARALPSSFPDNKIVRRGVFTPDVGYTPEEITAFGRALDNVWRPQLPTARRDRAGAFRRATVSASWDSSPARRTPTRSSTSKRTASSSAWRAARAPTSSWKRPATTRCRPARRKRSSASSATSPISSRRIIASASRTSTRTAAATKGGSSRATTSTTCFDYQNYRVQFIEEGMMSNGVTGEHFFQGLANSRVRLARRTSRAQTATSPTCARCYYERPATPAAIAANRAVRARRRIAERLPHVQHARR